MSETGREIPAGLNEFHVVRLFKCAVKDDDTLVDAIVERAFSVSEERNALTMPGREPAALGVRRHTLMP
jgi:hypothetical protein